MSGTPQLKTLTINGEKYIVVSETDPTLSVSGKAADAKAVGNAIGDIETALDSIIAIQNSLIGGDSV